MVDDLLDMSRIMSGKMRLDVQRLDVSSAIEEAVASAQPAADAKGVRLVKVLGSAAQSCRAIRAACSRSCGTW